MKHLRHPTRKDEVYEGDLVLHHATFGGFGREMGAKEGVKGIPRPICKAEPVHGGWREGAGRVQGRCKDSARRG